ncbi:hypothetical protein TrST_g8533 [Triparma strigata]|uniref:Uncharacterized protein n=1 Tax=Triparma strigata TaxID=1606541 RepID=A0A9W7BBZ6_9STRA|nr:hypothetical protein TrST_g8533 [Triparma strigata]
MATDDFRRLFIGFVMVDTLAAMRWLDRKWHKVVEKKLTELEDEPYGEVIVHGGNDISDEVAWATAKKERMRQVTKVVILLNITKALQSSVDSLQELGYSVFWECSKLVPSTIDVDDKINDDDVTSEVVSYLRSIQ